MKKTNEKEFFSEVLSYIITTFTISPKDITEKFKLYGCPINPSTISSWKTRNAPNSEYFKVLSKSMADILKEKGNGIFFKKTKEEITKDLKKCFADYNLTQSFEAIKQDSDDMIAMIAKVLDAAYQNKNQHHNPSKRKENIVTSKKIEITKYNNGNDEFYLIDDNIYYYNKYGMHRICCNISSDKCSPEQYISEDPQLAISAMKSKAKEIDFFSMEELTQRDLAENLFLFGAEENMEQEKILEIIDTLKLRKSVIADIIDDFTSED